MQNIRSNITRLKNQIEDKIPDGSDVLDFPGITRAGLVQLLESAHAESYELLGDEDDFEVILLKRKVAQSLERCREYLSNFDGGKADRKKFDGFVIDLTNIRDQIRVTYLVCKKSGLRVEDEILKAKESIDSLVARRQTLQSEVDSLLKVRDELKSKLENIGGAEASSKEYLDSVQQVELEIEAIKTNVTASFEVITKYEQQITEAREMANDNAAEISSLVSKGSKATEELSVSNKRLEDISEATNEQQKINTKLSKEISDTLAAANRVGMAGSFDSRKHELRASLVAWGICFGASIVSILTISIWMIMPYIQSLDTPLRPEDVGLKILIVAPLVWLAWMSAKQYGYVARIREDYSFKYATAMAFEGYKKQAQEIDEVLLRQLMSQAVDAVGQNPIRLYSNGGDHASPGHEFIDKVAEVVKGKSTESSSN